MPRLDLNNILGDLQAVTVTAPTTNVKQTDKLQIGRERKLKVKFTVGTAFTAGGAATLTIALQSSDTVGSGYADLVTTPAIAVADLVAGKEYELTFEEMSAKTYVRANYTVATGPMLTGTISAVIMAQ
jgi:hypothetical protein